MIGGSASGKANSLFNLTNRRQDIDRIYLYSKHPHKAYYQFLISKRKSTGSKHFNDSKAFIEYFNDVDDIKTLKNIIQIKKVKY